MSNSQPQGFLTLPPTEEGPGVLVLHPWWGLNNTIKTFCQQLADEGFVAFAPDLYHGQIATTIAEAEHLSGQLDASQASAEIAEAVRYLDKHAAAGERGLAVIGFSLGAYFALEISNTDPEHIGAVVIFYGTGHDDYSSARAAYLGHFAADDPYEPEEAVKGLEAALQAAGRPVTLHHYAGTGHWFFEPDRPDAYNPEAAALAWERTLRFLQESPAI
jgi:carboxymethylenebutenolidase